MENNKNIERIANSLEKIAYFMEEENKRSRRKMFEEMNEARNNRRDEIKKKRKTKVDPDKIIKSSHSAKK